MSEHVSDVSDATFKAEVLDNEKPVLVDFWAPWCGPCRMVGPLVDQLAQDMTATLKCVKVNVDENQGIAGQFGVMAIPSLMIFKGGEMVSQHTGAMSAPALKSFCEKAI